MTVSPTVDPEEYLASLPYRPLFAPSLFPPSHYQVSRWPLLRPYNGFTGIERRRGGQLATWLLAAGCMALPEQCDVCARPGPLGLHGENYYDPTRDPALCRRCHKALHMRSFQWEAWRSIVDASAVTGREWFALAPPRGLDLAQHLRGKFGWRVADIERSPISSLPDAIASRLPGNMLPHPSVQT